MTREVAFNKFKKIDSNIRWADFDLQYMKLIDEIFDYFDSKKSCDGCIHKNENEVMDYSCFECSRYHSDRFEAKGKQ